jgi:uncharacterized OsmC-like protein
MGVVLMSSKQSIKEMKFSSTATWTKDKLGNFRTTEFSDSLPFSCPSVLGGISTPSPEDLFLTSIATCTVTTLLHMCDRMHTTPNSLQVIVRGSIRLIDDTNYHFEAINCEIDVSGEEFLLERACELIPKYCVVSNAIKTEIIYHVTLNSEKKFTFSKKK